MAQDRLEMSCRHGGVACSTEAGQASITRAGRARYRRARCPRAHTRFSRPHLKPSLDKAEKVWEGDPKKTKDLEQMPCRAILEKRSA